MKSNSSEDQRNAALESSRRFRHLGLRILMLIAGSELATLGISLTTVSGLGTTPISTLPYVLSRIFPLSFGATTFILNVLFLGIQAILLGRRFPLLNLLQIPAVIVFSCFIDMNMFFLRPHAPEAWISGMAMSMLGNAVLAAGIVLQVRSKTVVQPGECMVLAFSTVLRRAFGSVKIVNDVTMVILAAALSWCALGAFVGLREGTLVSALLVGLFVKAIVRVFPERRADGPHEISAGGQSGS